MMHITLQLSILLPRMTAECAGCQRTPFPSWLSIQQLPNRNPAITPYASAFGTAQIIWHLPCEQPATPEILSVYEYRYRIQELSPTGGREFPLFEDQPILFKVPLDLSLSYGIVLPWRMSDSTRVPLRWSHLVPATATSLNYLSHCPTCAVLARLAQYVLSDHLHREID